MAAQLKVDPSAPKADAQGIKFDYDELDEEEDAPRRSIGELESLLKKLPAPVRIARKSRRSKTAGTLRQRGAGTEEIGAEFLRLNGDIDDQQRRQLFGSRPYEFLGETDKPYPIYKNVVRFDYIADDNLLYTTGNARGDVTERNKDAVTHDDDGDDDGSLYFIVQIPISMSRERKRHICSGEDEEPAVEPHRFPQLDDERNLYMPEYPGVPFMRIRVSHTFPSRTATAMIGCSVVELNSDFRRFVTDNFYISEQPVTSKAAYVRELTALIRTVRDRYIQYMLSKPVKPETPSSSSSGPGTEPVVVKKDSK